jgi:ATP-dependent Lon protease
MNELSQCINEFAPIYGLEEGLPLIPIRDIVVFPYMVLPLFVGRESSIKALEKALATDKMLMVSTQLDSETDNPTPSGIHKTGCLVRVLRSLKLPDGGIKIIVQGIARVHITHYVQTTPFFTVKGKPSPDSPENAEKSLQLEALIRNIREELQKLVAMGHLISPDILVVVENSESPGKLADAVMANLGLSVEESQEVLEIKEPEARLSKVGEFLHREAELTSMQHKIQTEAKEEMTRTQREYFLREQLRAIQKELGEVDEKTEEANEFREQIEKAGMAPAVKEEALKQLGRLEKMHPEAPEAAMVRTYLEWLTELPWAKFSKDTLDLRKAKKVLDEDHYGLEMVKERILEYLGVRKLKDKTRGPVLCFVGPPGVGKSSLGKSIARAMGRKFVRVSLGGVHDEAEIRGHRRTYVGAMPGRIIQGIRQTGSNNPVFMLDEVDKIGSDFRGDPSAALLEVLDPEQNHSFSDHYLGVPFDLSNVMFITTANHTAPIPSALMDRMEVIDLPGYTADEKLNITREFLLPKKLAEHGITEQRLQISDKAITKAIEQYTREAGLRNIEREIAAICRKVARKIAEGEDRLYRVTAGNLSSYLGVRKYIPEPEQEEDEVGVATGLVWTFSGGDIIYVEAALMKGKGELVLTGQLGDVMKESAQAALSYVRSRAALFGLERSFFSKKDIHIHVPAGAVPKDGPSAGITIAASISSVFTGLPVSKDVAMTGEITLRGKVLPVDGLREKLLAARRAGIKKIIVPAQNGKDLSKIPKNVKRELNIILADQMDQVLEHVLVRREIKHPSFGDKVTPQLGITSSKEAGVPLR